MAEKQPHGLDLLPQDDNDMGEYAPFLLNTSDGYALDKTRYKEFINLIPRTSEGPGVTEYQMYTITSVLLASDKCVCIELFEQRKADHIFQRWWDYCLTKLVNENVENENENAKNVLMELMKFSIFFVDTFRTSVYMTRQRMGTDFSCQLGATKAVVNNLDGLDEVKALLVSVEDHYRKYYHFEMSVQDAVHEVLGLCEWHDHSPNSSLFSKLSQLKSTLIRCPEVVNYRDDYGQTLLHHAAQFQSPGFCQALLDLDPGAVSVSTLAGELPLHYACSADNGMEVVKMVFDSYPEAIHQSKLIDGMETPLDVARSCMRQDVVAFLDTQIEYERQARQIAVPDNIGQLPIHRALLLNNIVSVGTIKLMVAANSNSLVTADSQGLTPLHIACRSSDIDIIKYLVDTNESPLRKRNSLGEFPLQIACGRGRCDVINYILEKSDHGVSTKNSEKKLPIQVLLFDADCDRDSLKFVEAVGRLLFAYPVNPADLVKENDQETKNKESKKRKRAFTNSISSFCCIM
eukprot:scaffold76042_cov54-Cyclotella_meneghiniana.AAC.3